jgi:hypothetical protein
MDVSKATDCFFFFFILVFHSHQTAQALLSSLQWHCQSPGGIRRRDLELLYGLGIWRCRELEIAEVSNMLNSEGLNFGLYAMWGFRNRNEIDLSLSFKYVSLDVTSNTRILHVHSH